ncbi:S-layer homology domain-containing protein [Phosphitispora fastidiosa]|uniref:S-layer homology domain-containing protein n=1 Tax=Phosphitispora fastidiosa TaxID=2837202 RepID=UPI001E3C6685|nr:S-layer homology domain-containing protein [Phosphitispora fastidiosa]MBU7008349.1 hypothetical protein [Phosphitispora fastidiosa]
MIKKLLGVILVFLICMSFIYIEKVKAAEIPSTKDYYLDNWGNYNNNDNFIVPDHSVLMVGCYISDGVNYERAALQFDLNSVSGTITGAALKIYISQKNGSPVVNLYGSNSDAWSEPDTSIPSQDYSIITNDSNITQGQWKEFDVTDFVLTQAAGDGVATFVLTGYEDATDNDFAFDSREDFNYPPQLVVTYATDTTPPSISSLSPADNAVDIGVNDNMVITFDENVVVGTGNITIKRSSDDSTIEAIDVTGGNVTGGGTDTITINPNTALAGETGYYVQIDATAFDDETGNSFAGIADMTTWNFTTADVTPPTVVLTDNEADNIVKQNDTVTITATFSEAMTNAPTITITNGGVTGAAMTDSGDSAAWTYDWTVPAGNAAATVTVAGTDLAGNAYVGSDTLTFTIDNTAPNGLAVPSIIQDLGASGFDGITKDQTLKIEGTAEAGSIVEVFKDEVSIGTTTADGSGSWSFDYTGTALPEGTYVFTAAATDAAGNTGALSPGFTVIIDLTAPEPPVITSLADDTGASASDKITNDNTLVFSGTAEANSYIEIFNADTFDPWGLGQTDEFGNWSVDLSSDPFTTGTYNILAVARDSAGNQSNPSTTYSFAVDRTVPTVVLTDDEADNIVKQNDTVTITATFSEAMTNTPTITVTNGGVAGAAMTDSGDSTAWTYDWTVPAGNATAIVTVAGADLAGNGYAGSDTLTFTIDNTAPTVTLSDNDADDIVKQNETVTITATFSEAITNTPTITITNGGVAGAAMTDSGDSTVWTYDWTVPAGNAAATVTAAGTDLAGNAYAGSDTLTFSIDNTAPVLVSVVRDSDTQVTVALSEDSTDIAKANDGGFTVEETGDPLTTYAVSGIAQGTDAGHVVLTVADMGISAKEGVTVKYTAGGNGTVQDLAGNALATDAAGLLAAAWDSAPAMISSGTLAADNSYMDVVFSEGIYGTGDGTAALTADKLSLTFTQNGGTATGAAISSVKQNDNADEGTASALTGGETTVRLFLNITGTPDGNETIEITPTDGASVYDEAGNATGAGETTGVKALNDKTPPTLVSAVRDSDTQITVTLSENSTDIAKANDGGFTVEETGDAGTTYAVASIAQGVDAAHVVLTVADMGISAKEGITVKYTAGGNGTVQDLAGNALATDAAGVSAAGWDSAPAMISSGTLAADNSYIDVVFSEGIYGAGDGTAALTADKLSLTFTQNGGTATGAAISSVKQNDNADEGTASALTGGETTVRIFLSITGTPDGNETIEITPADGASVYDEAGNATGAGETTGVKALNDKTPPTLVSVVRDSDTQITVTLSKDSTDIAKANDGGFTVEETGDPLTTYAVSGIAQGVDAAHVVLTVADMGISAKEGVTVKYTAGGNGTVQDLAGNALATDAAGLLAAAWDSAPAMISSGTLAADNSYMDVVFSEGIYGTGDGTAALTADKLSLTFTQNGGTATGAAISSVKQNDNADEGTASALTGGETTVRLFLNITGTPDGNETIEITPADGASVYDEAGNATGAGETTGVKALNDQTPPTVNTLTPADNAVGVGVNNNLVITFDENVVVGAGNITIKKSSDDSVIEAIDVTGAKVSGGGTDAITVNPDSTLISDTAYYLQVDATAFEDMAGNNFAGISDAVTWNFITAPSSNADLSSLSISSGILTPAFSGDTTSYTASVANSVYQTTVTAAVYDETATIKVNGAATNSGAPSEVIGLDAGSNSVAVVVYAQDGVTTKIYEITITRASPPSRSSSNDNNDSDPAEEDSIDDVGDAETTNEGDRTVTTVTVDEDKIEEKLNQAGAKVKIIIPVNDGSDVVVGELTGKIVRKMEDKEAVLEIKTERVIYTIPAAQININEISAQIGEQVELKDIKVKVKIAEPEEEIVRVVEDIAVKGNYQLVVKPVELEIECTGGDKTIQVSKFNNYVERMFAIPEGVDPDKITTGVVVNPDGTFSHVPTTVIKINGKYYARINSLTNSIYTTIWNPRRFADVDNHWSKEAVNDMGSRLVISGYEDGTFKPGKDITRAEFAAIVVNALGLREPAKEITFSDIKEDSWYYGKVSLAYEYGIVSGYTDGSFKPDKNITREEAMAMVAKAMPIAKLDTDLNAEEVSEALVKFTDAGQIAEWAKESSAACVRIGIIGGYDGKLTPKDKITRAETAVIVRNVLKKAELI